MKTSPAAKGRNLGKWCRRFIERHIRGLYGLQPHRSESFKLSTDPFFIEKLRDVVGLNLSPPQNALVLCVDEKSQCQALERTQPMLPMGFGYVEGVPTITSTTAPRRCSRPSTS